ncbi:MAG: glycosyltransferase [bacterium]|nr:glycosyltransferase [bacterium]
MMQRRKIAICVATFRRRALLGRLLDGLAILELPTGFDVELRVVENDRDATCRVLVRSWAPANGIRRVRYDVEPERNIALARNRALDMGDADMFAFLDDDEQPEPDWLVQLTRRLQRGDCDAVIGNVEPVYPPAPPDWVQRADLHAKRVSSRLGPRCWQGTRTANALIDGLWLRHARFRRDYGRTGGEDTELFARLVARGARLGWAPEARVHEVIHEEQCRLRWLWSRYRRAGSVYERIVASSRPRATARAALRMVAALMLAGVSVLSAGYRSRRLFVTACLRVASAIGGLEQVWIRRSDAPASSYQSAGCTR